MPASSRFVILANFNGEAVLDRETGLVWQRAVSDAQFDSVAAEFCHESHVGGRYGWRLPTVAEATSLFDPSVTTIPSLPLGHPFTGFSATQAFLWTSSRDVSFSPRAPGRVFLNNTATFGTTRLVTSSVEDGSNAKSPYLCVRSPSGDVNY
jgi:hypothetical protein